MHRVRTPVLVWLAPLSATVLLACGQGDKITGASDTAGAGDTGEADVSEVQVQPDADADADVGVEVDGASASCAEAADGVACDDGAACTLGDQCLSGECVGNAVTCDAPTDPCVSTLACDPATGECTDAVWAPAGSACDLDDDLCTRDSCDGAGGCGATGEVDTCAAEAEANPCWSYACVPDQGCAKRTLLVGAPCDDDDPCTQDDTCGEPTDDGNACLGTPISVDDDNPCTDDTCVDGAAEHAPVNDVSCDPEAECDVAGACVDGVCEAARACVCPRDPGCPAPVCTVACANGGACVADDTCDCGDTGYDGATCATPVCDPPCANGTCTAPDTCDCADTGYDGATCATPVCDPPCANGTCSAPDTCDCGDTGYDGATCATPVCDPPCANGTCSAPDTCDCADTGYAGETCATPVCDPPCANGTCSAPDTCDCADTGYDGATCATPVCDPPCANGTCTAPDTCDCGDTGYDGATCATPVCDPPCANGTCAAPDTCDCGDTGYDGATCATPVCDPPCANGTCAAPDTCDCADTGYAGETCATPVCDPPCANGTCAAPDTCDCGDTGYDGATCASPVCDPPCANGTCAAPDTCDCGDTGYDGATCATPVCDPPCDNGVCGDPDVCDCGDTGYTGETCAAPLCEPACDNGGACVAPDLCDCTGTGYGGETCASPPVAWIRTFGTPQDDSGGQSHMLIRSHEGTFLAVGTTTSTDSDGDAYLVAVDGDGDLLSSHTYGGAAFDGFSAIAPLGAGYVACGSSRSSGANRSHGYCVTTDAAREATGSYTFGGSDVTNVYDVIATDDGHFLTAGNTTDTDAWLDVVVRKHTAAGGEVWKKYFARSKDDTVLNALALSTGGYLLTGYTGGWSSCEQYYALKLDAAGAKAWERTYGGCISSNSAPWHVARQAVETEDGGFVATGNITENGVRSAFLQAFDAAGAPLWLQTYGGSANGGGVGLVATSDGGYAIVGSTRSSGAGGDDIYLVKTDSTGTLQWERTFGGAADDQGASILQLADGGFMLAGTTRSWGAGGADLVIIRTDADGNVPVPVTCTPACQHGGTCVADDACDCAGTGYFGDRCEYAEADYTDQWTKDTEPRVVALNAEATVGTIAWKRLVGAEAYKVWHYAGANYGRELVATTTNSSWDGATNNAYRVEAVDLGGQVLDFVSVGISNRVVATWTTGTFTDDFEDGAVASNYLNLKPHQVTESGGVLQLTQTVTDDYSSFYLPYDTEGRRYLKLTARVYQHRTNSQYTGGIFYFPAENSWKSLFFGCPWEDYRSWRGGQLRYTRYRADVPSETFSPILALDSVSRFDAWFDYEIVIDTVTGVVSGRLGDETFPAQLPVDAQFLATGKVLIYFTPYGWFTGHYLRIDDLRVESYDPP